MRQVNIEFSASSFPQIFEFPAAENSTNIIETEFPASENSVTFISLELSAADNSTTNIPLEFPAGLRGTRKEKYKPSCPHFLINY